MKSLFLSLSALIAGTAMASAADLPYRAAPVAPVPAVAAVSWTGFYAGVHGAWLRDEGEALRTGLSGVSPGAIPARAGLSDSGLGGGAQIGYLWDFGSLVAGLEADLTAMDVGRTRSFEGVEDPFSLRTDLSSQMSLFGSVKGRLGLAMPSLVPFVERSLVYVTGGLAYARIEHRSQITVTPPGVGPQASSDGWKTGFVLGAGTEHMLTDSVSLKTETLYYNLEDETLTLTRAGDQARYRLENDGWISRVGVNVRF
ncbi:outer membrane protein [Microvirga makkahensis]|uniref:Outer membrane beta-barrel protein n=1 Tax=Microvirga makkahensis TaxID=1128670 RepID=A0A7X3MUZ8_9HYPH|nr:outer membrane beta-barrel protein [Microvirga makkahensis]MXQ13543.1 outer membrane beta-barrel protein [Microvirga makkahensis]